jgi:stage II sporulation protein D
MKDIEVMDYTEGDRVRNIRIGDAKLKGTEVRRILSLKSANFTIEKGGSDTLKITVCGSGHGVGMSQWGANYLAGKGAAFEEIIRYYYQGVGLTTIDEYQP